MKELLPDTDNFFKYLMTIGLVLVVFVIIYPVQEQKEVDLEINSYIKDTSILKYRIYRLRCKVDEFKNTQAVTQHYLDSLKALEPNLKQIDREKSEALRQKARDDFNQKKDHHMQTVDSLYEMNITSDAEAQKIRKLEGYFSFFKTYKIVLLIVGMVVATIGLFYWTTSVYRDEKKKDEELHSIHESAFVRHCKWIRHLLQNKVIVILLTLLALGAIVFIISVSISN